MKVADAMSKQVEYVSSRTPVKTIATLIFGRGINGVPVCEGKKVVGFITEKDIVGRFYPTIPEFIEDPVHSMNFEDMESRVDEIFSMKAKDIMNETPSMVTADTPILKAHSLMIINKVGRLPVVDDNGNLVGLISRGDIFRVTIGDKLPIMTDEKYHDWLSRHYDLVVDWEERLKSEIDDLAGLFKKEKVNKIIDIGCGTGEHDVALAKANFNVLALEKSNLMHKTASQKLSGVTKEIKERLDFKAGDYTEIINGLTEPFDAAIFMGNAFLHLAKDYEKVLSAVAKKLSSKNTILVFQLINLEKVFKVKDRFLSLNFNKSKNGLAYEHAFLEFYNPPVGKERTATLTMVILDYDGKSWRHRSINSTPVKYLLKKDVQKLLKKYGFNKISFYGGTFNGPLFKHKFDPTQSDWLNVVAVRG